MTILVNLLTTLSFMAFSFASENGGYYVCDTEILASDNKCIFTLSGDQPADWVDLEAHNIDRDVGPVFYRGVEKYDGSKILGTSPLPWTNGDRLVATDEKISGDDWSLVVSSCHLLCHGVIVMPRQCCCAGH